MPKNGYDYAGVDIICPFFKSYSRREQKIYCEDDYSMSFPDTDTEKVYRKAYCSNAKGYEACLIAGMLEQKYDPITAGLKNR